jgi:hypothetical protein
MRAEEELSAADRLLLAAREAVSIQTRYAQAGQGLAQAALAGAHTCEHLRHYPLNDVVDAQRGCQFYYHAHGSRRVPANEHGHFHLFMRDAELPGFFHLAALSLDARGWPVRWFTTNRWVTGEHWVDAQTAIDALPRFQPRTPGRLAPVARWLGAMVILYEDALSAMLRRRDEMLHRRLRHAPMEQLFEDRRLDVITQQAVSLPGRLRQLAGPASP